MYSSSVDEIDNYAILRLKGAEGLPSLIISPDMGANIIEWWVAHPFREKVNVIYSPEDPVKEWSVAYTLFGNPVLFPFANRVWDQNEVGFYRWEGKRYTMPCHGFAFWMPWKVIDCSCNDEGASVELELKDTPDTLERYPWAFVVRLVVHLTETTLHFKQTVTNRSDRPMPLSPGWHPYFRTPLIENGKKEECVLRFPARTEIKVGDGTRPTGSRYSLEKRQSTIGEWGCPPRFVTDFELPEASLTDPAAGMTIHIDLGKEKPDITHPYILTWSASDDAPFFCLEPYTGLTDAINNRCGLHILQSMECLSTSLSYSVSFGK